MIIWGCPAELVVEGDSGQRLLLLVVAMVPFLYVIYELLVGLAARSLDEDPRPTSTSFGRRTGSLTIGTLTASTGTLTMSIGPLAR